MGEFMLNYRHSELFTSVGIMDRDCIIATGKSGYLLYGPYVKLKRGHYRIRIYASFEFTQPSAVIVVDVVSKKGVIQHLAKNLNQHYIQNKKKYIEIDLNLDNVAEDVEVRIWVSSGVSGYVRSLHIVETGQINKVLMQDIPNWNRVANRLTTKPTLVILHIPKTAGTSLFHMLWDALPNARMGWYGYNFFESDMNDYKAMPNWNAPCLSSDFDLIGGHLGFQEISKLNKGVVQFASVIRNPVDLVYSYYNHIVNNDYRHPLRSKIDMDSIEYTLTNCQEFISEVSNIQCRYLSGRPSFEETKALIDEAGMIIETMENMAVFLKKISQTLGFVDENCFTYFNENVGTKNYKSKFQSKTTDQIIRQLMGEDEKLYKYIRLL